MGFTVIGKAFSTGLQEQPCQQRLGFAQTWLEIGCMLTIGGEHLSASIGILRVQITGASRDRLWRHGSEVGKELTKLRQHEIEAWVERE